MRNKLITILILQVIFLMILHARTNTFEIFGRINKNQDKNLVMLFKMLNDSILSVDSCQITDGTFKFQGLVNLFQDMAIITSGNYPSTVFSTEVILEQGKIIVNMDSLTVKGPSLNQQYQVYCKRISELENKVQGLWDKDKNQINVNGSDLDKSISEKYNYILDEIKLNVNNPIGYRLFIREISNLKDSDLIQISSLINKNIYPTTVIEEEFSNRRSNNSIFKRQDSLIGKRFTDFELLTPNNDKRKLSDFVGKTRFLYFDFWASWCSPCIADFPKLKKVYEKFKSEGLEIIGISLDESLLPWINAIKRSDAPWIHLSDLEGANSDIRKSYGIRGVPVGVLIDKDGIIINYCQNAESLSHILNQLLIGQ